MFVLAHWLTIAQSWGFVKSMIHAFTVKSQLHNRFQESSSIINDQCHSDQVPHLISETVVFLDSNFDCNLLASRTVNLQVFFCNDCQDSGCSLFWNLGPEGRGSITVDLLRSVGISVVIHTGAGHSSEHCFRPQEVSLRTVNQGDQAEQVFYPKTSTSGTTNQT